MWQRSTKGHKVGAWLKNSTTESKPCTPPQPAVVPHLCEKGLGLVAWEAPPVGPRVLPVV